MKQHLYIVGAGGFGREVYSWLQAIPESERAWEIKGFLDDAPDALNGFEYPVSIVGAATGYLPGQNDVFVCGIGAVDLKRAVCQRLIDAGAAFLTLIHPSAVIGAHVKLGAGVVVCPHVTLTCDIEVGSMTMINCQTSVGHDARIGAWSTISAHCDLTGFTEVGEGAFLGSRVTVIPGKRIGSGAVVGAGSVVIRSVGDGVKVFGNPAREFA